MSRQIPRLTGTALLAVCIAVAACGDDGEAQSPWLELLARVPDTPDTRTWIQMNDYQKAREVFGMDVPDQDAEMEEVKEYTEHLFSGGGPYGEQRMSELQQAMELDWLHFPEELDSELGFTFADLDHDILVGLPGRGSPVLCGRIDRDAIDEAVHADPVFSDILKEASHEGVAYYSWGEDDPPDSQRQTVIRPLGRGHLLALDDGCVYWTLSTSEMEALIDAGLGHRRSLADDEAYQLLAAGLDRLDTYTAIFSDHDMPLSLAPSIVLGKGRTPERVAALREQFRHEPHLVPYEGVAAGAGGDSEGPFMALVVLHEDEERAAQNVGLLEQRIGETRLLYGDDAWADIVSDSEIRSDGRLLLAKLYTTREGFPMRLLLPLEPLLLYDDTAD